jgi:hypothetical protein
MSKILGTPHVTLDVGGQRGRLGQVEGSGVSHAGRVLTHLIDERLDTVEKRARSGEERSHLVQGARRLKVRCRHRLASQGQSKAPGRRSQR